jgi:hypothetical protein
MLGHFLFLIKGSRFRWRCEPVINGQADHQQKLMSCFFFFFPDVSSRPPCPYAEGRSHPRRQKNGAALTLCKMFLCHAILVFIKCFLYLCKTSSWLGCFFFYFLNSDFRIIKINVNTKNLILASELMVLLFR